MFKIQLYKSDYVIDNKEEIYNESLLIAKKVSKCFDGVTADPRKGVFHYDQESIDCTWLYPVYNIFGAAAPSKHFYNINKFVNDSIRQYLSEYSEYSDDVQIWCQSWINCHSQKQLLKKHTHHFSHHGYLSIDPKHTRTMFFEPNGEEAFFIENEPGLLYIGPGNIDHEVQLMTPIQDGDYRITLAFNVATSYDSFDFENLNHVSFIPVL